MKCPFCATLDSKVVDSRPANDGTSQHVTAISAASAAGGNASNATIGLPPTKPSKFSP